MAWIESHTVLIRHRKVLQLAVSLSLTPVEVVGHLHVLWHTVLEQQEDGNLTDWPDEMIALAAAYKGDPKLFVSELQAKKWLDGKLVHDWVDYAGHYLIKKYSSSNTQRLREIWRLHGYKYGKRDAKSLFRIANRKRTEREHKENLPNLPNQTLPNQQKDKDPPKPPRGALHVLDYLNQKSGKSFEPVEANLDPIKARLKEFTEDQLLRAIDHKVLEWKGGEMDYCLRPATLFNKTKCAQYVGQLPKPQQLKPKPKPDPVDDPVDQETAIKFIQEITKGISKTMPD